jgi:hypothetical protein
MGMVAELRARGAYVHSRARGELLVLGGVRRSGAAGADGGVATAKW